MRHGALGSAIISIENELTLDMAHYPQSKFLPRPPNHEQPLRFPQNFIEQSPIIYARQPRSLSAATTNERMSSIRSQDKSSSVRFNDSVSVAGRSATPSHKSTNSSNKTVSLFKSFCRSDTEIHLITNFYSFFSSATQAQADSKQIHHQLYQATIQLSIVHQLIGFVNMVYMRKS